MVHLTVQRLSVRKRAAAALTISAVMAGSCLAMATLGVSRASAQAVTRSGDQLAVMAVHTLSALRSKGSTPAAVPVADVAQPVGPPTTVSVASVQNAVPVTLATPADGSNWSSYVVDTPALGRPLVQTPPSAVPTEVTSPTTSTATPAQTAVPIASDYAAMRSQLARLVASRSGVSAVELDAVWAQTDDRRLVALFTALAQVGTPYRYTGKEPGGFDCSGLTSYSWGQAGVKIPRVSTDQINAAAPRSPGQLQPGDLVWRPGHIMMYVGIGEITVDSPQTGRAVDVKKWGRVSRFGSPL